MTGCARREEVFLEEMDSDEENSNRKAGEESTAYENNVAAGENPEKQSVVSDAGSEGNTENSALDLLPETPIPQKIFVDVCGAVVNPGVYELDEGARIFQAVDAAGGYLPEAAINYLNRARSIGDGQQIYVPTEKEVAENLELAMAKVPEALNDGDNSGNLGLEEIQGSSVENPSGTVERDTGSFGDGAGDDPRGSEEPRRRRESDGHAPRHPEGRRRRIRRAAEGRHAGDHARADGRDRHRLLGRSRDRREDRRGPGRDRSGRRHLR